MMHLAIMSRLSRRPERAPLRRGHSRTQHQQVDHAAVIGSISRVCDAAVAPHSCWLDVLGTASEQVARSARIGTNELPGGRETPGQPWDRRAREADQSRS